MKGRDRTAEFMATIKSRREKPQWIQQRQGATQVRNQATNKLAIDPQYRELMRVSQTCSKRIKDSIEKLERFTVLARKRTVFDDNELNKLIADIRSDIGETKSQLDYLQSRCEPKQKHTGNIVTILQRKLANVTSDFKSTLEIRSRSVQQQTARHELYGGPSTSSNPNPYLNNGNINHRHYQDPSQAQSPVLIDMGNEMQNQYDRPQMQMQKLLMNDQIDMSERADKMHSLESTIVELGTVFNQLATLVQTQGETITRIDTNISETTANVEAAHDALLRYFASINNNRWLILKVFGVLFFFFIVFVMFAT